MSQLQIETPFWLNPQQGSSEAPCVIALLIQLAVCSLAMAKARAAPKASNNKSTVAKAKALCTAKAKVA